LIFVGLAISRITKHRIVSKGGPTALRGEPAYKHRYLYYNDYPLERRGRGWMDGYFITPGGANLKGTSVLIT
jgi:hypothetical protein